MIRPAKKPRKVPSLQHQHHDARISDKDPKAAITKMISEQPHTFQINEKVQLDKERFKETSRLRGWDNGNLNKICLTIIVYQ